MSEVVKLSKTHISSRFIVPFARFPTRRGAVTDPMGSCSASLVRSYLIAPVNG